MSLKKVLEHWKGLPVEELLRQLYVEQNMSISAISKELDISVGIVHKWLSDYNITKIERIEKC